MPPENNRNITYTVTDTAQDKLKKLPDGVRVLESRDSRSAETRALDIEKMWEEVQSLQNQGYDPGYSRVSVPVEK